MKIEMLRTMSAVVETGSFAAAAAQMSLTPSAVSMQMKQVENYFGRRLFDRSGTVAVPTPYGLEAAETISQAIGSIEALRMRRGRGTEGVLRLGIIPSALAASAPAALQKLRHQYPDLSIRTESMATAILLSNLKGGSIDAALVVRPTQSASSRLHWRDVSREAFVLLAPPGSNARTPAEALSRHGWIRYHRGTTGGKIAAEYVRVIAPGAKVVCEAEPTDAIVAMVSGGLGATVLPRPRQPLRMAYPMREIELGRNAPWRQLSFCRLSNASDTRAFDAVVRAFEDVYARIR